MAAIDVALSIFQKANRSAPWLFFNQLYGGTNSYIDQILRERRGIHVERFLVETGEERFHLDKLEDKIRSLKPHLLYFEPVTNPLLIVSDGREIIRRAKENGVYVIVDNTFATPWLWNPLEDGADLVIHSATKYLSGHGNVTAGVVCGADDLLQKEAMVYRKLTGPILSPDDAYRLGTQIKTFCLRFSRQCENAKRLASRLLSHPCVNKVRYPGLPSHPTYAEAVSLFQGKGFGAMVNFELSGDLQQCEAFIRFLQGRVSFVPTLGDPDSILIHVPAVFGEEDYPYPSMFRLSVGFEDYDRLENFIFEALEVVK
jgi:cystathionine beta-lyase/cystathionine gamma-synthase